MHVSLKLLLLAIIAFAISIAVITVASTDRSLNSQGNSSNNRQHVTDLERWPIADFDATLPVDPANRAKRQAKNKKYDKSDWPIVVNDVADSTVRLHKLNPELPAFPARESRVILIGRIASAAAYLSNDKTGVYSEFTIVVEEVLKNDLVGQLVAASSVVVSREGGRIRFPSGRIHWYGIGRQRMPCIGGRYVLFLSGETEETLNILTGYELDSGKVTPLDDLNNPNQYRNADEVIFMRNLKESLTSSLK